MKSFQIELNCKQKPSHKCNQYKEAKRWLRWTFFLFFPIWLHFLPIIPFNHLVLVHLLLLLLLFFVNLYYNVKSKLFSLLVAYNFLRSHNFTLHYFNMYFLIEFKFILFDFGLTSWYCVTQVSEISQFYTSLF